VVPDGGAGSEFDDAIGAAIPEGDSVALPNGAGVMQHLTEFGQALSLDRRSSAAGASERCGGIKIGVEAQSGDDTEVASDGGEEPNGGKRGVADDDDTATRQPAVNLQNRLTGPVQQRLGCAWGVGIEAFGRRKHGEEGQAHDADGP
jgi:hypothetical protein